MSWVDKVVLALAGGASTELPEDPEIGKLVRAYLAERGADRYRVQVKETPSGAALLALPAARLGRVIHSTLLGDVAAGRRLNDPDAWYVHHRREKLVSELCRRALPITVDEARAILDTLAQLFARDQYLRYKGVAKAIGRAGQAGCFLHGDRQ